MLDRSPSQVGDVTGRQRGEPRSETVFVVGQAIDRFVDNGDRHDLAAPVDRQLDRLVGDLTLGLGSRPGEVVGCRPLGLAREHLAEVVLRDDDCRGGLDRRHVGQAAGQLGEAAAEVGAQLGHHAGVEHDRLPVAAEEVERAPLHGGELGGHGSMVGVGCHGSGDPASR